ncbi:Spy/CpxP family protein refolding chaperone [Desulfosarcina ovata]|uniref:Zinc resistance-associated protein n=1 Tax=Desulfosarcina ovata subsp. ovata TaxID=2752305 RepID=A0A5K8ACP7_9BACT|nr:periplasmic heavy metal sensor [Desulfosarcina ovata]BBO90279.1 hypothetical protein DSCOOX_34590 [Desulfosarcina ovata subsp. ovata]
MKTRKIRTIAVSVMTVAFIAMGSTAFAGKGMGSRSGDYRGSGWGYNCPNANLTDEQREQLDNERQAYFNATKNLRQDLYAKRLELRAEVAKKTPDQKRAAALQEEVSKLNAGLAQKRLAHFMTIRKINPDAGRGFFGNGRGNGHHGRFGGYHQRGMGYGANMGPGSGMGYGPGYCQQ